MTVYTSYAAMEDNWSPIYYTEREKYFLVLELFYVWLYLCNIFLTVIQRKAEKKILLYNVS